MLGAAWGFDTWSRALASEAPEHSGDPIQELWRQAEFSQVFWQARPPFPPGPGPSEAHFLAPELGPPNGTPLLDPLLEESRFLSHFLGGSWGPPCA